MWRIRPERIGKVRCIFGSRGRHKHRYCKSGCLRSRRLFCRVGGRSRCIHRWCLLVHSGSRVLCSRAVRSLGYKWPCTSVGSWMLCQRPHRSFQSCIAVFWCIHSVDSPGLDRQENKPLDGFPCEKAGIGGFGSWLSGMDWIALMCHSSHNILPCP